MPRRRTASTDMSCEDFNSWSRACGDVDDMMKASGENGGPVVSLVPNPHHLPADSEPDAFEVFPNPHPGEIAFDPDTSRFQNGWTAERQMIFIERLAETGTVHAASRSSGLSARSAYRLRARSPRFAAAWNAAQQLAVGRLSTIAFDRAINGRVEQVFDGGHAVLEKRVPSDRLLMWLLVRLDPARFAAPWERRADDWSDPQADARAAFPALLEALTDTLDGDFAEVRRQCDSCDSSPALAASDMPALPAADGPVPLSATPAQLIDQSVAPVCPLASLGMVEEIAIMTETKGKGSHTARKANATAAKEGEKNPRKSSAAQAELGKKGAKAKKG